MKNMEKQVSYSAILKDTGADGLPGLKIGDEIQIIREKTVGSRDLYVGYNCPVTDKIVFIPRYFVDVC